MTKVWCLIDAKDVPDGSMVQIRSGDFMTIFRYGEGDMGIDGIVYPGIWGAADKIRKMIDKEKMEAKND